MRAHRTVPTITAVVLLAFLVLLGTGTHTVARGETLAGIARSHGTTVAALAAANGVADPNHIEAGTRLVIPGASASGSGSAASSGTRSYTVRRGDTLGSIAATARSTISAVVNLNRLKNPNLIRIGQLLTLPGGTATSASGGASSAPAGTKTPAGGATTHVVRAGDTIGSVARRYEIPQAQLIAANGLTNGTIYVGQRLLLVPRSAVAPAPAAGATRTHTVRSGETLSDIARRYGTTIGAIQRANRLRDANHVVVGQTLTIPAGSTAGGRGLTCPVRGAMEHMNDWGFPRSAGRFHEGNDLFAARGTPAVAMIGGNATQRVGVFGGNQVKLLGDDGVAYYYTHLDRFGTGGRVKAGEVIGYVGSTGNAVGGPPHIHFEVHPGDGAAVNPFPIVAAAC